MQVGKLIRRRVRLYSLGIVVLYTLLAATSFVQGQGNNDTQTRASSADYVCFLADSKPALTALALGAACPARTEHKRT